MYSIFLYVLAHVHINTTQAWGSSLPFLCLAPMPQFPLTLRPTSAQFPHCRRLPLLCPFPPRACLSINRWWKPSLPSLVTDKTGRTKIQKAKLTSMGKPNDLLKSCMIVQLTPGRGGGQSTAERRLVSRCILLPWQAKIFPDNGSHDTRTSHRLSSFIVFSLKFAFLESFNCNSPM